MKKNNKRGFTLLELLVVVAIIGILATVVTIFLGNARAKARDAERMSQVNQIRLAIDMYKMGKGKIPNLGDDSCLKINNPDENCYASSSDVNERWKEFLSELEELMPGIKKDPCPNCSLAKNFLYKLYLYAAPEERSNYEYVYETPASIRAYLDANNIKIEDVKLTNETYSIYAKNLETKKGKYGFGLIVDLQKESNGSGIDTCPYRREEGECIRWLEDEGYLQDCKEGDFNACKVIFQYSNEICFLKFPFCGEVFIKSCEGGYNESACRDIIEYDYSICLNAGPFCKEFFYKIYEEKKVLCEKGDKEACIWMDEHPA